MKLYTMKNIWRLKWAKKSPQFLTISVIIMNSVIIKGKNCYPQGFLGECKYVVKEKNMLWFFTSDDSIMLSGDSDKEDSNEEN